LTKGSFTREAVHCVAMRPAAPYGTVTQRTAFGVKER